MTAFSAYTSTHQMVTRWSCPQQQHSVRLSRRVECGDEALARDCEAGLLSAMAGEVLRTRCRWRCARCTARVLAAVQVSLCLYAIKSLMRSMHPSPAAATPRCTP